MLGLTVRRQTDAILGSPLAAVEEVMNATFLGAMIMHVFAGMFSMQVRLGPTRVHVRLKQ
ncbi:hypothetical protein AMATHDRAFT_57496 [Amanita thiersii Skay4041]|uniref:Uncharacterized protein n=1 Tax=Amanita thiersii Skay4041 TaxID=703135 RepID=A0A2A9NWK5_9AGAR|nr:hypothetical protein AMATHDRAFT_57496 [Amanita thiersii Skay4041]